MADAHVIAVENVDVTRGGGHLVRSLTWRVEPGERWVVLGPNGAGKTTLLNLAAGQLHPTRGQVTVLGEKLGATDLAELRTRIGLTTTALADRLPADERVRDLVMTAAWSVLGRFRESYDPVDAQRADQLLAQWGVGGLAERRFGTLSEGERKRAQIARALMPDPELLLLDEPAAGLDLGGREELVGRLAALAADPAAPTVVMVTHHVEEIPAGFTHALLLRAGTPVAQGLLMDTLTDRLLTETFGLPLRVSYLEGRFTARAVS